MTTIALEQFPPALQALLKAALHDTGAVITENERPLARVQAVSPPAAASHDHPEIAVVDERFPEVSQLPVNDVRRIGGAKGFLVYMADDFNAPVDDFGDL
ncbi:MAG: hypothetical protein ACOYMN_09930 [Roseimicrobium sp.]